jgi:hypothetical protein
MNVACRFRRAVLGAGLLLAFLPAGSAGQQRGPGRLELERQVWARFGETVRQRLALAPESWRELEGILRTFREDREALTLREAQLRRRVVSQGVLAGRGQAPPLSDAEAREILAAMAEIRREESGLALAEQERLLEVLTPSQLVVLYALRDALNERARRLRQGGPGPGRVGGAGLER